MRATVDNLVRGGSCWSAALMRPLFWWRRCWTAGADEDVTEVEAAIERVAAVSTDPRRVRNEIWLLRPADMRPRTANIGTATARWRHRSAS